MIALRLSTFFVSLLLTTNLFASWQDLEKNYQVYANELEMREKVEEQSYDFTKSLCVEFRVRWGHLPLNKKNTPLYLTSISDWFTVAFYGVKATWADSSYHRLFFFKSHYIERLFISEGFLKARSECAEQMNMTPQELQQHFDRELAFFNDGGNIIGYSLTGGVFKRGFAWVAKTKVGQFLGSRFGKVKSFFKKYRTRLMGSAVTAGASYILYQFATDYSLLYKFLGIDVEINTDESIAQTDKMAASVRSIAQAARLERYLKFSDKYLLEIGESECSRRCKLSPQLESELNFLRENGDEIKQIHSEMHGIFDRADDGFFETLQLAINKVNNHQELLDHERDIVGFVKTYGSLDLIIQILSV